MCIIAMKPANVILSETDCRVMWRNNPDGAGFMFAEHGILNVVKGLMTFNEFWEAYDGVGQDRKIVLHFRIRTHGAKNAAMTHPFWLVEDEYALVHNGMINGLPESKNDSDTAIFVKQLQKSYSSSIERSMNDPFIQSTIEARIGYSKLVFMNGLGETKIFNEHLGEWDNDVWYSNSGFHAPQRQCWKQFLKEEGIQSVDGMTYTPRKPITTYWK